jgi:hypothetical protein
VFEVKKAVLDIDTRYRFVVKLVLAGPVALVEMPLAHRSSDYEAAKAALAEVAQALGCPVENPMERD